MTRQPWDDVFDRVRVEKWPEYVYPFRPTSAELDAAEAELGCRLPASYRAFAERFGWGELTGEVRLTSPTDEETRFWRTDDAASEAFGAVFTAKLIVFGHDSGGSPFAFQPEEMTNDSRSECRVYLIHRLGRERWRWADTFAEFVDHVGQMRSTTGVIRFASFISQPAPFSKKDVQSWLAANSNAARNLGRAIREENRPELFPVLGDALEDAGCDSEHVLRACRDGNPRADGDWVLAVLLGSPKRP